MAIRHLTDICDIQYGFAFDASGFTSVAGEGMPLVRIRDVMNGRTETYFIGTYPKEYIIHKGDFLVGMDGEFNIAPWKSDDALLNQRVCRVKSNQSGVSTKFLFWFLKKELKRIEDETPFVTVKHLSAKRLKQVQLEVPPITEQEKIVAELDCLTGIIEKKKQQLDELDKLAQSIFYDMFGDPITNEKGWEVKLIREIAFVKIGPFGSLLHAADYITGGYPVINPVHMRDGRIYADEDFTVSQEKRDEMTSYLLERDDIIFGRRGDIGRCALVSAQEAGYICGTGSLIVRFKAPIVPLFALNVFLSNEMRELLIGQAKGATMLNINCGIIEMLPVILPSMSIQNEFAEKIEAIEKQKELLKRSIVETETLFNSRMDYWFN